MWKIEYSKRFLKELSKLPEEIQRQAEELVFGELLLVNPFDVGSIERMKGYPDKYKVRVGKYRIGITLDKRQKRLTFQRIAHRKDIYKKFP